MIAGKFNIKEYYTIHEIETKWGIDKKRIKGLRKAHKITTHLVGNRIFLKKTEVDYVLRKLSPTGYITMQEARRRLRFNKVRMWRWRTEGRIQMVRTDRHWICLESEVERILAERGRYDNYVYGYDNIAKALGVRRETVNYWVATGRLKLEKYNALWRVHEDVVRQFTDADYGGKITSNEALALFEPSKQTFYTYKKKGLIHSEKKVVGGRSVVLYSPEEIIALRDRMNEEKARLKAGKITVMELSDLFGKGKNSIHSFLKTLGIGYEKVGGTYYYDKEYAITMLSAHIRKLEDRREMRRNGDINAAPTY